MHTLCIVYGYIHSVCICVCVCVCVCVFFFRFFYLIEYYGLLQNVSSTPCAVPEALLFI